MNSDPLIASVATALAQSIPAQWSSACVHITAHPEVDDTVGLNVDITGPDGEKIESPDDNLVQAITGLYVGYFEKNREWTKCTIEIKEAQGGKMRASGVFEFANDPAQDTRRYKLLRSSKPELRKLTLSGNLAAMFCKHAALSLDKHLALAASLPPEAEWQFDLEEGMLRFGESVNYPVQALGAWNDDEQVWEWAWSGYEDATQTPEIVAAALRVRQRGIREDVAELANAKVPGESINPDCLAMIACGLCGADFWFECRDDEGSIYLIGEAPELRSSLAQSPEGIVEVFSQLLDGVDFNHRFALESYLLQKGCSPLFRDGVLMARSPDGRHIEGVFNEESRLQELIIS